MATESLQYYDTANCSGNIVVASFIQANAGTACKTSSACIQTDLGYAKTVCPGVAFPGGIDSYVSTVFSTQTIAGGTPYISATSWSDTGCSTSPQGFVYVLLNHCLSTNAFGGNSSIVSFVNGVAQNKEFSDMSCQDYYTTVADPKDSWGIEGQCKNSTTYRQLMTLNNPKTNNNNQTTTSSSSSSVGIIAGSVVAAIVALIAAFCGVYSYYKKQEQKRNESKRNGLTTDNPEDPIDFSHPPPEYQFIAGESEGYGSFPPRNPTSYPTVVGQIDVQLPVVPVDATEKQRLMEVLSPISATSTSSSALQEKLGIASIQANQTNTEAFYLASTSSSIQAPPANFDSSQSNLFQVRAALLETKVGQDPLQWSAEDVCRWALKNGGNTLDTQNAIKNQDLNGRKLLSLLSEKDVSEVLKVKDDGIRTIIWNGIQELKALVEWSN